MSADPLFLALLRNANLPAPVPEYRFDASRRWRADYCWPDERVILEVEGGVWTGGRHTRGAGFVKDMDKYNRAAVLGYRLLRCTPKQLHDLQTIGMLAERAAQAA